MSREMISAVINHDELVVIESWDFLDSVHLIGAFWHCKKRILDKSLNDIYTLMLIHWLPHRDNSTSYIISNSNNYLQHFTTQQVEHKLSRHLHTANSKLAFHNEAFFHSDSSTDASLTYQLILKSHKSQPMQTIAHLLRHTTTYRQQKYTYNHTYTASTLCPSQTASYST